MERDDQQFKVARRVVSTLTDHGGAASQSRLGALQEVVHRPRAQVGLHQAGVDIYPPWYHHATISLDHLDTTWHNQILPHLPAKDKICAEIKEVFKRCLQQRKKAK